MKSFICWSKQIVWYKLLSPVFSFLFKKEQIPLLKRANGSSDRKTEKSDQLIFH